MAKLQVKGIADGLDEQMKRRPAAEVLLQLSGSWEDPRPADAIIAEIRNARENSQRLIGGR